MTGVECREKSGKIDRQKRGLDGLLTGPYTLGFTLSEMGRGAAVGVEQRNNASSLTNMVLDME